MKATFQVTELTKDELINLFSTALYGCNYLDCSYDKKKVDAQKRKEQCYEDNIADCLLNGGTIKITDYYSDGETYGKEGVNWLSVRVDGDDNAIYTLDLKTLLSGMASNDKSSRYIQELFVDDEGDYYTANNLMQIILFGDIIYG